MLYPELFKDYITPINLADKFQIPWLFKGLNENDSIEN